MLFDDTILKKGDAVEICTSLTSVQIASLIEVFMEEDMMMPNVAPAPMMQETPMAPNLSEQMPAQTEEVTQAEMQEAQGALQQILQVIDMLIQQGLSAEEIAQFLEQYGISEDELEQAAQILGVDINQLLGGQQRMPMAQGGPSDQIQQGMSDNEPMMQDRSIENQIFTLQSQITNLMNDYNIAVNDQDFNTAQAIANQINNLDVAISQMQAQMPMGLGEKKN